MFLGFAAPFATNPTWGTSCTVHGPVGLNADEWPRYTGAADRSQSICRLTRQGKAPKPRTVQPRDLCMERCSCRVEPVVVLESEPEDQGLSLCGELANNVPFLSVMEDGVSPTASVFYCSCTVYQSIYCHCSK